MKKYIAIINNAGNGKLKAILQYFSFLFTKPGFDHFKKIARKIFRNKTWIKGKNTTYNDWIAAKQDATLLKNEYITTIGSLKILPRINVILALHNPKVTLLKSTIQSIIDQQYIYWQLSITLNDSSEPQVKNLLREYAKTDTRIIITLIKNCNEIAEYYNTALISTTGDHILVIDQGDELTINCLFEFVKYINIHPADELIYADQDVIDDQRNLSQPYFKPGWAPDNLLSDNYIGNAAIIKKTAIEKAGGFKAGFVDCCSYDLLLRITEFTEPIGHIAKVLYHKQTYALQGNNKMITCQKAIESALERRNTPGIVSVINEFPANYYINYNITLVEKVSIIIPTKDQVGLLKTAIDSVIQKTDYQDYEIIVLNNNSVTKEFFEFVNNYKEAYGDLIRFEDANFPFNYSKLMNLGASLSSGSYLLMLNNDVKVIQSDWMTKMISYAQRTNIGAVGVKLLYPDDTIQHAGIVLGINGDAGHIFSHFPKNDSGYHNYLQTVRNYTAVTGACMMCRKTIYNEAGGMDEQLVVEYNDLDLCLKLLQHGYYNLYLPTVELYHYESATRGHPFSSKKSYRQHEKDFTIFKNKWPEWIANDPFYNPNLSFEHTDLRLGSQIP